MDGKNNDLIKKIAADNNLGEIEKISRFETGLINHSYDLDGKYALKIEGNLDFAKGIFSHQKEITDNLLALGAKVPKIIASGKIEKRGYIIMEKIKGRNVVYDWMDFSGEQRENLMEQLAEQLKIIHSIKSNEYEIPIYREKRFRNLAQAIGQNLKFMEIYEEKVGNKCVKLVAYLMDFYEKKKHLIEESQTAVLVHNDIHLENILHENGKITGIIDWDWASYAPKDYELWRFAEFCYNPSKFVEKKMKSRYIECKMSDEIKMLKKYYPELFASPDLPDRIRLFLLETFLNVFVDYQTGRWNEEKLTELEKKVDVLYKTDWIEKALS